MEVDPPAVETPNLESAAPQVAGTELEAKPELNGAKTIRLQKLPLVKPKTKRWEAKVMKQIKQYARQVYGPVRSVYVSEEHCRCRHRVKPKHAQATIEFVKTEAAQKLWDTAERDEKGKWHIQVVLEYCGKRKLEVNLCTFVKHDEPARPKKVLTGAEAKQLVLPPNRRDLFIGKLPMPPERNKANFKLIEEQIKTELESKFGPLSAVRCPVRNKKRQDEFAFAFVEFQTQESALNLINTLQPSSGNQLYLTLPYAGGQPVQCYVSLVRLPWHKGVADDELMESESSSSFSSCQGSSSSSSWSSSEMERSRSCSESEESINGFLNEENMEIDENVQNGVI